MGILSFVLGIDPKKLQERIKSDPEQWKWLEEFNSDTLNGKNILDYLGGELALSLGGLDPNIVEGWNVDKVEKIDTYLSLQVLSEEKGKELIEIFRKKLVPTGSGESMGPEDSGIMGSMVGLIANPLIEDYN